MLDLVLDVGQSSTRARLLEDGAVVAAADDLPGFVAGTDPGDSVLQGVTGALRSLGASRADRVGVGSTGLFGTAPDPAGPGRALHRRHGTSVLRIADDGLTALLGAFGGRQGATVAVGTGVVAFAWGPDGAARADGVGAMIGDDGSGWWIGRAGLIAAISHHDGRLPSSAALLDAATARYGPVGSIPGVIAASPSPVGLVAAFAADVADAARAGDAVAAGIWQRAGTHVAAAVLAVAARAGLGDDLRWSLLGNVGRSADLLEPALGSAVRRVHPGARRHVPATGPLDGVAALLRLEDVAALRPAASEFRHA